jgi:enoyl-CoA hydratase/carnithine racemase
MGTVMSECPVSFELRPTTGGRAVAVATLNAEKSLNALTLEMVEQLSTLLREWAEDERIVCVMLRGAGDKAFCAGGDVVRLHQSAVQNDTYAQTFFEREYRLDYLIHTYRKPVIVWGHGIVMGGGLGLLAGASHRVVTAQTRMAMPEVTIGLYPDVGGSFFLNRMPGRVGLFLGLTGAALNAGDALFVGLADYGLVHEQQASLLEALETTAWSDETAECFAQLDDVLGRLSATAGALPVSNVRTHFDAIQSMTAAPRLADQVAAIAAYAGEDAWLTKAAAGLKTGCPTSIRLIPAVLDRARQLSLREVFQLELGVSTQCVRLGNFQEGVRALLIDKDRQPRYAHAALEQVPDDFLALHFRAPWGDAPHPLADL